MTGIACIKVIMILFIAPPVFFYLAVPKDSIMFGLSYVLPSGATFYGLMDLLNGYADKMWFPFLILFLHAVFWSIAYRFLRRWRK